MSNYFLKNPPSWRSATGKLTLRELKGSPKATQPEAGGKGWVLPRAAAFRRGLAGPTAETSMLCVSTSVQ